jgi:hypothetical protein
MQVGSPYISCLTNLFFFFFICSTNLDSTVSLLAWRLGTQDSWLQLNPFRSRRG